MPICRSSCSRPSGAPPAGDARVRCFALLALLSASCVYRIPLLYGLVKNLPLMRTAGDGYIGLALQLALATLAALGLHDLIHDRTGWRRHGPAALAASISLAFLVSFGRNYNPPVRKELAYPPAAALEALPDATEPFRAMATRHLLPFSSHMPHGLDAPFATDVLEPLDYTLVSNFLVYEEPAGVHSLARIPSLLQRWDHPLLDFLNIRYVLTTERIEAPGFTLFHDGPVDIYRNQDVLPRAFLVHEHVMEPDLRRVYQLISSGEVDLRRTVILDQNPTSAADVGRRSGAEAIGDERARITSYGPNRLTLQTRLESPGILVTSEAIFPGWHARVDGQPAPLLRANHAFRAVALSAGEHEVIFEYRPWTFTVGMWLSMVSLVFCLGIACLSR